MMKSGIMKSTLAVMFLISLIYMSASEAQSQMDISVTKDVDNAAPKEGEEIEYTITVSNDGSELAFFVSVNDKLPAGLTYITHSSDIGTATYDTQKGSISWDLAFFSSGTSATLTIRVSVDSNTAGTEITNTAKVGGVLPPEPIQDESNNADDATISVQSEEMHLEIEIDVKPGNESNSINLKSKGVIPVAILTTSDFDATTVDPSSVRFGQTGTEAAPVHEGGHIEDVNGDGNFDLLFHFRTQETGLQEGDTEAYLTGEILTVRALAVESTGGGQAISGCDAVKTSKKAPQLSGISRFATWGSIKTGN